VQGERTISGAQNHCEGAESLWGCGMTARFAVPEMSQRLAPKSPRNVTK